MPLNSQTLPDCSAFTVDLTGSSMFYLGPVIVSSMAFVDTTLHNAFIMNQFVTCFKSEIISIVIQAADGSVWLNTARISLSTSIVAGLMQPSLTIAPNS